jgi:trans-aconitate 2-methyltransferase
MLAIDASADMVALARKRLGDRAEVWCQDVLELDLDEPVDAIVSTATLHWVTDHDRLWARLARALRGGGVLEAQCGGEGNIDGVREVIDTVARDAAPELMGWSPWVFASPEQTERRLREAGFTDTRCWLELRPTARNQAPTSDVGSSGPVSPGRVADHEKQAGPGWHDGFADALLGIYQRPQLADLLGVR